MSIPRRRAHSFTVAALFATALLLFGCSDDDPTPTASASPGVGRAQGDLVTETDVPDWVGKLLNGSTVLTADEASTQEELPGFGHKFQLFFEMNDDYDPQNPTNEVVSVLTTPATIGLAVRNLPPGIKIEALDHQLNLKYYFPDRSCGGGSPRIQLAIDLNGDGNSDGNAFGYVGRAPFGALCLTEEWDIIDMTDNIRRWDLSQFPGGLMTMTWDEAEALIMGFLTHRVLSGSLVDDSCSFALTSCGQAYYDLVTIENRTLENHYDTVRK